MWFHNFFEAVVDLFVCFVKEICFRLVFLISFVLASVSSYILSSLP